MTSEPIPDPDLLYYRIHKSYISGNLINPSAIRDIGCGMSLDWSKYSTPTESQGRAKIPQDNAIVSFTAGLLRKNFQTVNHTPSSNNRAHSEAVGSKDVEIRVRISRNAKLEIGLQTQS